MWSISTLAPTTPGKVTICLYGDTGDGKSTQIGLWAEDRFIKTGRKTRVYTADPGGWLTLVPYVKLGIIDIVPLQDLAKPWEWLSHVVKGSVIVEMGGQPAFTINQTLNEEFDTYAFEGMTAFGDALMQDAAKQSSEGRHIGGEPPAFRYNEGDVKWAGNSRSHFGSVQTVLTAAIQESLRLPKNIIWTAMAKRANDNDYQSMILGPQVAGKALTSEVPRWFNYTGRLMSIPADDLTGRKSEHRLYLDDHCEINTPGAKGLGNGRVPFDAYEEAPSYISPANIVKFVELWDKLAKSAEEKIRARVAAARPLPTQTGTAA